MEWEGMKQEKAKEGGERNGVEGKQLVEGKIGEN